MQINVKFENEIKTTASGPPEQKAGATLRPRVADKARPAQSDEKALVVKPVGGARPKFKAYLLVIPSARAFPSPS